MCPTKPTSKKDDHSEAEEAATVAADVTEATAEVTADEAAADTAAETDAVAAAGTETEIDRTRLYSQLFAFLLLTEFLLFFLTHS